MFNAKGRFFVVEGIDGSGKSTLARGLENFLISAKHEVELTREPGKTSLGKEIRTIVQGFKDQIAPDAEFFLFTADRVQHIADVIKPALFRGATVISDRFKYSSLAYQGYGRGLDKDFIQLVNDQITRDVEVDIIFYCKIEPADALARCFYRREKPTRFEDAGLEFMQRVSDGFDEIFKNNPRVVIIDANRSQDEMQEQAVLVLKKALNL